ncbi:FAD-dependent tricarballylate dehydrogenase TcuA [Pseudomonas sp. MAP12]|uniref:FAD-dependent tricarballylate dehydrogenase TcuA n=1 Tax=Geopseudomonas aromaticivorans TaxID=2849492 RepID=A0ABS6MTM8_9GAMM|nr:FAD-dependent tricarballylate dehydrogenase TcuA [Pseudomonas aromaticivorans]MBV2132162.1 FAD-dependent tricarballylate dehydrogenase TcuA [Pseudomonas aromaticivorans]
MQDFDVIVIGGGNAGLCAALSAHEQGARVALLERAPEEQRGGNSAHTGGAFRVAYRGVDDLRQLMPDLLDSEIESSDFGSYTQDDFYGELAAQSQYRADPEVLDTVVSESLDTLSWMTRQGVRFMPIYGRQAFKVDGKYKFWGGLTVEVSGGGLGLVEALMRRAERNGIELHYGCRAQKIGRADGRWQVECADGRRFSANGLILATGGFHGNLEWRAKYLGPGWDLAKVRGSRFNTGDGIRMAMDVGAVAHGNWSGCHAVFYDVNAPELGDLDLLNMQKNYFHLGVVVNADGKRFVDEGLDFRNYTYSGMGAKVLQQPGGVAWQLFDQHSEHLLPDEYRVRHATRIQADTLEELAGKLEGVNVNALLDTLKEYNAAVRREVPFNPAVRDGRSTQGLAIPKSNWANPLERGPFVAYAVTCGITFTFGGLKVNSGAQVIDEDGQPIPGLYAAGELVGNLYYVKYAGGAGLTSGSVLGRIAGAAAASQQQ